MFLICLIRPSLPSFPTRRSSDLVALACRLIGRGYVPHQLSKSVPARVCRDQLPEPRADAVAALRWVDHEIAKQCVVGIGRDRKSTRLNSSHVATSYAVFCLKKKI